MILMEFMMKLSSRRYCPAAQPLYGLISCYRWNARARRDMERL
jgi:hypothetical protein